MAREGEHSVECIDIVARHVARAKRNIENTGMDALVSARVGDYHHLEGFGNYSFDGIYTMETFVHSTNPKQVLREFFRLLKPGGRIAMHEYDHESLEKTPRDLAASMMLVNPYAAMPANAAFNKDTLKCLLEEAGFEDVCLRDLSQNIVPLLWLFYMFAIVPYLLVTLLGLERYFVNTVAGVQSYRGRHFWRYVQVTGRKPMS